MLPKLFGYRQLLFLKHVKQQLLIFIALFKVPNVTTKRYSKPFKV